MTETFTCCHCGQAHPLENRVMVGDDIMMQNIDSTIARIFTGLKLFFL